MTRAYTACAALPCSRHVSTCGSARGAERRAAAGGAPESAARARFAERLR